MEKRKVSMGSLKEAFSSLDRECGREVSRIAEQDELVVSAVFNPGYLYCHSAISDIES